MRALRRAKYLMTRRRSASSRASKRDRFPFPRLASHDEPRWIGHGRRHQRAHSQLELLPPREPRPQLGLGFCLEDLVLGTHERKGAQQEHHPPALPGLLLQSQEALQRAVSSVNSRPAPAHSTRHKEGSCTQTGAVIVDFARASSAIRGWRSTPGSIRPNEATRPTLVASDPWPPPSSAGAEKRAEPVLQLHQPRHAPLHTGAERAAGDLALIGARLPPGHRPRMKQTS